MRCAKCNVSPAAIWNSLKPEWARFCTDLETFLSLRIPRGRKTPSGVTVAEVGLIHAYQSVATCPRGLPSIRRYAEISHRSLGRAEDGLDSGFTGWRLLGKSVESQRPSELIAFALLPGLPFATELPEFFPRVTPAHDLKQAATRQGQRTPHADPRLVRATAPAWIPDGDPPDSPLFRT